MGISSLKVSDLDKTLNSTICSRYKKVIDNYIIETLKDGSTGSNFSIPIAQYVVNLAGGTLEKRLLELYDKKFAFDDTSSVSKEIKLLQALALDGLVVGVNTEKNDEIAIYTANMGVVFQTDEDTKFSLSKAVALNKEGVVHAVRLDIEYTSEEGFVFKPVSLNKNTNLRIVDLDTGEGRFHLVPYMVYQRCMLFFKTMLDDGYILKVHQDKGGMDKVRYLASRNDILVKYSDSEEFAKSLKATYFPLKGFFYCPVVGASSMTTGLTRVDLLSVFKVINAKPEKLKLEKPVGGIEELIDTSYFVYTLQKLNKNDSKHENRNESKDSNNKENYINFLKTLPKIKKIFPNFPNDVPSPEVMPSYLHQLSKEDYYKVVGSVSGIEEFRKAVGGIFTKNEKLSEEYLKTLTKDALQEMLKQGVYKIVIRKKNCMLSSLIVTNNKKILEVVYGKGYFAKLESRGVRLYELENQVIRGADVREALVYCGFGEFLGKADEVYNTIKAQGSEVPVRERLEGVLSDSSSIKKTLRKPSSNDSLILARKCFGYEDGNGKVADYYSYVDISKIESIHRLG